MKKFILLTFAASILFVGCKQKTMEPTEPKQDTPTVFMTAEITPESLIEIYKYTNSNGYFYISGNKKRSPDW